MGMIHILLRKRTTLELTPCSEKSTVLCSFGLVYENSMRSFRSGMAIRLLISIACAVFRNTEQKQVNKELACLCEMFSLHCWWVRFAISHEAACDSKTLEMWLQQNSSNNCGFRLSCLVAKSICQLSKTCHLVAKAKYVIGAVLTIAQSQSFVAVLSRTFFIRILVCY